MENKIKNGEDYEFSEEFIHNIAQILELCYEHNTDTAELSLNVNGKKLHIEITFSITS